MSDKPFGEKVRKRRIEKKISQEKLGDAISVSQGTICKWESSTHSPPFPKAIEIIYVLEMDITDFIDKSKIKIELL